MATTVWGRRRNRAHEGDGGSTISELATPDELERRATTMKAISQDRDDSPDVFGLWRLARVTGLLLLVLAVFGMFSVIVLRTLLVPGDAVTVCLTGEEDGE
jgi:hypothetical protein